uniref:Uncharacterized protein n=1 Tax=Knipowitschia caucasica TaxID=637954 RepID=A0AAV2KHN0_KNICA
MGLELSMVLKSILPFTPSTETKSLKVVDAALGPELDPDSSLGLESWTFALTLASLELVLPPAAPDALSYDAFHLEGSLPSLWASPPQVTPLSLGLSPSAHSPLSGPLPLRSLPSLWASPPQVTPLSLGLSVGLSLGPLPLRSLPSLWASPPQVTPLSLGLSPSPQLTSLSL